MTNHIYELAMKCKEASDKNVHIIMKQQGPKREPLSIMVDGYQFQESVLSLASAISEKYPSQASELKRHLSLYEENRFLHQGAIDAIISCLISIEDRIVYGFSGSISVQKLICYFAVLFPDMRLT